GRESRLTAPGSHPRVRPLFDCALHARGVGVGRPINPPSRSVVEPEESTSESTLWREFAEATTPEAFHRAWLAIQCRLIPGVGAGAVFSAPTPGARLTPTTSWPEGRRAPAQLAEAAERALSERRGIVLKQQAGDEVPATRHGYDVAYPIQTKGEVREVVALAIEARPAGDIEAVLRQLQWGAGWLELLAHRRAEHGEPTGAEAARQRL